MVIRHALNHMDEFMGQVTTDDLLVNILGKVCIGKTSYSSDSPEEIDLLF